MMIDGFSTSHQPLSIFIKRTLSLGLGCCMTRRGQSFPKQVRCYPKVSETKRIYSINSSIFILLWSWLIFRRLSCNISKGDHHFYLFLLGKSTTAGHFHWLFLRKVPQGGAQRKNVVKQLRGREHGDPQVPTEMRKRGVSATGEWSNKTIYVAIKICIYATLINSLHMSCT